MSGYTELRNLGVVFGPFDGPLPPQGGRSSQFDSPWGKTVALLARELNQLEAKRIVIELALREGDFRIDGLPKANARLSSPAVRVTFASKWGPLRYETAEFSDGWGKVGWQENLRAIALSMEALRAVDRYGVSKRGEQYRGWKALATGTDPADAIVTREQARAVIDSYGGMKQALMATHPDQGGDPVEFRKVTKAKEILA